MMTTREMHLAPPSGAPSRAYTTFADAYLAGSERTFSEAMAAFALARVAGLRATPLARVADIACGIGAACIFFAKKGLEVHGTDQSEAMIRNARASAEREGLSIRFAVQDYREFAAEPPVDLVTCMYDSLNFMRTEAELTSVFRRVRTSLAAGGYFIFDMYTVRGLAETWGTKAEIHTVTDDHFVASQTVWSYETCSGVKVLYGFSRRGEGPWERWEERHTMSAYPVEKLRSLLEESGFRVHDALDWQSPDRSSATEDTHRVVFVAEADAAAR